MSGFEKGTNKKIWFGILIGLVVVGTLLYLNIRQTRFIEVTDGSGNHCWVDINQNGIPDLQNSREFLPCDHGSYRKETLQDAVIAIHWGQHSILLLFGAFLFMALRDLFYMLRIRLLSSKKLSFKSSFHTIMLWEFASALSPGVMSGAAVAMFILHRERIPLGKSTAMVMVTAMLDNLFFSLMIPIVFVIYGPENLFPSNAGLEGFFWSGYSIFLLVFIFFFLSLFIFPVLVPSLLKMVVRLPLINRWKDNAEKTAEDIHVSSRELKSFTPILWLKLIGYTFGSWISRFMVINCLLAAFLNLSFIQHALIMAKQFILWLFMRMSPTPGGSGVAEYIFGELMSPFGGSVVLILGLAFVWRILSYYSYLIIGSMVLPGWLRKNKISE